MLTAACPACGAPVLFRGATSIVAVCVHCGSTLVRDGTRLADIGKAAQVIDDHSPLQVGATGRWRNVSFLVAGRVQYRFGAGTWSEWHLVFDNGRSGWLSDDMGELVIEFLQPPVQLPDAAALAVGGTVVIDGTTYEVAERSSSAVVAVQGELPVRVAPGEAVHTVDLRDARGRFVTLDFGSDPQAAVPRAVYAGTAVTLAELQASGLRDVQDAATGRAALDARATAFACPSCGAPLTRRVATTEAVACGSCGAVVDVTDTRYQVISRSEATLAQMGSLVPLGATAELQGTRFEVIGVMRRAMQSEGLRYAWHEYLLHAPQAGYRFLVHADTHWGLAKLTNNAPRIEEGVAPKVRYLGQTFKHFATYDARVEAVVGEFFWRVTAGETAQVMSFVSPPNLLTRETTADESVWSLEEYLTPQAVWERFGLKGSPPPEQGVAPHQPPPFDGRLWPMWRLAAGFAVLALLVHLALGLTVDGRVLLKQAIQSPPAGQAANFRSSEFDVPGTGPLGVRAKVHVVNSWAGLDMELVDVRSAQRYAFGTDVAYYSDGPGDDEPEGAQENELRIVDVPAGRYVLEVNVEGDPGRAGLAGGSVEIYRARPSVMNLVLAWLALALAPFVLLLHRLAFEKRRWADSDHASKGGGSDDDDDDDD